MSQWHEDFLAWQRRLGLVFFTLALLLAASSALADAGHLAFVQADGSLRVNQRTVHLHGIYMPDTGRDCETAIQPAKCGSRAALALERRIQGMVYCERVSTNRDRSLNAVCRVDARGSERGKRQDLAAFLLREGWAVALPGAPFEYTVLEKVARTHRRGIWGFQADSIGFR